MSFKHQQQPLALLHEQKSLFRSRLYFALGFVILLFIMLIGRMIYLQVNNFQHYHAMSEGNRISVEIIPPVRGRIYDRNNVVIADNRPVFVLKFVKNDIKNINNTLFHLKKTLPSIPDKVLKKFFNKLKLANKFRPLYLPFSLNEKEAAHFSVTSYQFPGITLTAKLKRYYPFGKSAVHALGYVGKINQRELKNLDLKSYQGTEVIGKLGVEKQYESLLHGYPGIQQVETNAKGRVIRKLETLAAIPGQDIQLTIDIELQKYIEQLVKGQKASVVVIKPKSGEILAYVSEPGYDPNLFIDGISQKNYNTLLKDAGRPLVNRVLNGQYPPASTVKPFIALAALEHNTIPFYKKIKDPGYFEFKGHKYRDWKKWGHGEVDMEDAITQSCDTYFYKLGLDLGIKKIHNSLYPFGFGHTTGIDLSGESRGILPSKKWKRATKGKSWFKGDTIIAAIGQGYFLATPLQLAKATATLANRGKIIQPHLLKEHLKNNENRHNSNPIAKKQTQIEIQKIRNWNRIINAMGKVMKGPHGTARAAGRKLQYPMAGKTGTSQVYSIGKEASYDAKSVRKNLRDHSLFIGFAPINNPEIAISVVIENAEIKAAPVAVAITNYYLNKIKHHEP